MKVGRKIIGLIILIIIVFNVEAQDKGNLDKQKKDKKEPYLFWGGSLWLGFGSYTYVDVNATFGVQVTKRLNLGVSGKYQYYKDKGIISGTAESFETSVYGGSVYSQFAVIEDFRNLFKVKGHSGILAHVEYEFLNTKYNYVYFDDANSNRDRYWLHNLLIGGGYFQEFGKKSRSYIVMLWNVTRSNDNPYIYPQLRIGFSVGF